MTCRHAPGDTSCSSHPYNVETRAIEAERERERERVAKEITPDPDAYRIEDVMRVGSHLVLKVKYPNCKRCAYEGSKIMVFLNVTEAQALRWRRIDPHFRNPKSSSEHEAPSPAARFPGNAEGWKDALDYAKTKTTK